MLISKSLDRQTIKNCYLAFNRPTATKCNQAAYLSDPILLSIINLKINKIAKPAMQKSSAGLFFFKRKDKYLKHISSFISARYNFLYLINNFKARRFLRLILTLPSMARFLSNVSLNVPSEHLTNIYIDRQFKSFKPINSRALFYYKSKLSSSESSVLLDILVRFLENLSGSRVVLSINRAPAHNLPAAVLGVISLINTRIMRIVGSASSQLAWSTVGEVLFLSFLSKDSKFIINWLHYRLTSISSFSHKRFFTTLIFLLRTIFQEVRLSTGIRGVRLDITGKISVSGNARTRTILFKQGDTSFSNTQLKVNTEFYLVRTFTGCLGLTVWLFYVED